MSIQNADDGIVYADQCSRTGRETTGNRTRRIPVIGNDILLPNGQVMNAKTTLQSFDTTTSRRFASTAVQTRIKSIVPMIRREEMILPSGELINAKNTTRSYDHDIENPTNMAAFNRHETMEYCDNVVDAVVVDTTNHTNSRQEPINECNVIAYAVHSYIVAKSETIKPWFNKRFVSFTMIIIGGTIIGSSLYCAFGKCGPSSALPKVKRTPSPTTAFTTTVTPTHVPIILPILTPTTSPLVKAQNASLTSTTSTPSQTSTFNAKETAIMTYINSITLSNRTIHVNGTTAEDLAMSWIIYEDPIFTNVDDSIWSTLRVSSTTTSSISSTHIRLRQRYALLSLWFQQPLLSAGSSRVVQNWRNASGWLQIENECYWYGIQCDYVDIGGFIGGQRIVTEIDFYDSNDIVLGSNNIAATIPADFGLLTSMKRVDLSGNNFFGTIPASLLENWAQVEIVNLANNSISGTIPESIGFMHALQSLNIAMNKIAGVLPESIGQCIVLEKFHASDNHLTGSLPASIGNWKSMEDFKIQANHLSGTLPASIGNWTAMTNFYLCNNLFHGTVPETIGRWAALENFNIEFNSFTGTLPHSIGQLSTLNTLDVSDNMLTGTIPESIGNCTSLEFFSIEDNIFDGPIPSTIGMLTSLTTLFLHSNKLTGTIPDVVGRFTSLQYISAKHNQLSGTIPLSVGNWSNIVSAHFYNNSFTGTVPNILCTFNALNITADCELVCDCCNLCV